MARAVRGAGAGGCGAAALAAMPRFNLIVPRSTCPHCQAPITALQNIPVLSYLALRRPLRQLPRAHQRALSADRERSPGLLSALVAWKFGFGARGAVPPWC